MRTVFAIICLISAPGDAVAFCGGWNDPVAFGFDASSWMAKWPILGVILFAILTVTTFSIKRSLAIKKSQEG